MGNTRKKLRIGISMGDVNGIGPELVIRTFEDQRLKDMFTPIIYGSTRVLNIYRKVLNIEKFSYNVIEKPSQAQSGRVSVVDCVPEFDRVDIGKPSKDAGYAAMLALKAAVADLKAGEIDTLVTMPIDKHSIQSDEFDFPGHTEYLAHAFGQENSLMLMASRDLRVATVTGHVPLKEVAKSLTVGGIVEKIRMLNDSLKLDFNLQKPTIAVLGLNPHAGDNGLLGKEEKEKIAKALEEVNKKGIVALGPFSADGFFGSGKFARFDGILAMYHDQGLIPFKLISGFEGVNFTAGLPAVRTSPDHGLAYELAGKGTASLESFTQACFTSIDIFRNRTDNLALKANSLETAKNRPPEIPDIDEDVPFVEETVSE